MLMINLYNYLARNYEKVFRKTNKVKEQSFQRIRDNWDWYNIPGSLFGFEYFISPNPMIKQDKENFTKSLGNIITSNFEVIYNSSGVVLIPKRTDLESVVVN